MIVFPNGNVQIFFDDVPVGCTLISFIRVHFPNYHSFKCNKWGWYVYMTSGPKKTSG